GTVGTPAPRSGDGAPAPRGGAGQCRVPGAMSIRSNTEIETSVGTQPAGGVAGAVGRPSAMPGSVEGAGAAAHGAVLTITVSSRRSRTQHDIVTPLATGGHAFAGAGVQPAVRSAVAYAAAVSGTGRD